MISAYWDISVNQEELYTWFTCNKENLFYKELQARETEQNGGRKVIFMMTVYVILFSILLQLHRILFSCAVYIKAQRDAAVSILEISNALPLLQTPF